MKKTLIILGHPSKKSLCKAITDSYIKGFDNEKKIKVIYLNELKFDPILHQGYNQIQKLEPDLKKSQELIKWAEHIVFVYPIWWAMPPALLKGFIERVFLPGFAFEFKERSSKPEKYFIDKTASLILTAGGPENIYSLIGWFITKPFTYGILNFCGIKIKNQKIFGGIDKNISKESIENILNKVKEFGEKGF